MSDRGGKGTVRKDGVRDDRVGGRVGRMGFWTRNLERVKYAGAIINARNLLPLFTTRAKK